MLRTLLCDEHNRFLIVKDAEAISDLVKHKGRQLWLDVENPSLEELALIQDEFGLHPLAIEDASKRHQRPKVEQYSNGYFVVFYSLSHLDPSAGKQATNTPAIVDRDVPADPIMTSERIALRELAMFLGENYLITVHQDPIPEFTESARRWFRNIHDMDGKHGGEKGVKDVSRKPYPPGVRPLTDQESSALDPTTNDVIGPEDNEFQQVLGDTPIKAEQEPKKPENAQSHDEDTEAEAATLENDPSHANGIGILLYSLLDTIVDGYFPLVDAIVDRIEDLEEQIFERHSQKAIEQIFILKKDMLALRRILAPERDVLNILTRRDLPIFDESTVIYFRDVYDHIVRITDSIDTYRDLLSSALDSFLSMQSNRLNSTVQTLTSFSLILMTVAAFTGWYGMNFTYMLELDTVWGYPLLMVVVAIVVAIEVAFFKRKGWL